MHEVDWDSLYDDPAQRERDAILALIWKMVETRKQEGNAHGAFALITLAHAIEQGKHSGT